MKKLMTLVLLPLAAGCLSSAPKAPINWLVEVKAPAQRGETALSTVGTVRLASVNVRAPYDGARIAVLRPDGSIAFDAHNVFAAKPATLLKGPAEDLLAGSGAYGTVIGSSSYAAARRSVEVEVTRLAFDCTGEQRLAVVELSLLVLEGRELKEVRCGRGAVEPGDDFSRAFSEAFAAAMHEALER